MLYPLTKNTRAEIDARLGRSQVVVKRMVLFHECSVDFDADNKLEAEAHGSEPEEEKNRSKSRLSISSLEINVCISLL